MFLLLLLFLVCTEGCFNTPFPLNPQNWSCKSNAPELLLCHPGSQPFCQADQIDQCFETSSSASQWFFYLGATVFPPNKIVEVSIFPLWSGSGTLTRLTISSFLLHPSSQQLELYVNNRIVTDFTRPHISKITGPPIIRVELHYPPSFNYTSLTFGDILLEECPRFAFSLDFKPEKRTPLTVC